MIVEKYIGLFVSSFRLKYGRAVLIIEITWANKTIVITSSLDEKRIDFADLLLIQSSILLHQENIYLPPKFVINSWLSPVWLFRQNLTNNCHRFSQILKKLRYESFSISSK